MMSMMMGSANYGVGINSVMTSAQSIVMTSQAEAMTSSQVEAMSSVHSPDPPSPAPSDSSNSNLAPTSPPSHTRGGPKECGVCSDVAKSMHFGGLSCDSCKAFFRRSVQNNAYRGFSCPYERKCVIGVSSRKACQYCRFEKCISIGMEKSWVMPEDERRKMMEQRKEKKTKSTTSGTGVSCAQPSSTSDRSSIYSLSEEDRSEIATIVSLYKKAYTIIPYEESGNPVTSAGSSNGQNNASQVLGPWMTFCKRIAYFFSLFRDFAELSTSDQSLLLKTAITSAGIIMGSVVYDSSNGKWAAKISNKQRANVPSISSQSVEKLVPSDLISRVDTFFKKFQQVCPDETMAMILILISLYSPELMGLEARERVQYLQERYIHILQNYVKFKFREKSTVMFPKAIVSLADIRELADRTSQMRIQHDRAATMLPNFFQSSFHLGSPHSGISAPQMSEVKCEMNEVVPMSETRTDLRDPIYQRLLNLINQMHSTHTNSRQTSLLPLIIQILKRLAYAHQEGKHRAIANYGASTSTVRRGHKHKSKSQHRCSQRKKWIDSKREEHMEGMTSQQNEMFVVKEEVMDHIDENTIPYGMNSPQSSSDNYNGTTISAHDLMEVFPQHDQQFQMRSTEHSSSPPISLPDQQSIQHQQSLYHQQSYSNHGYCSEDSLSVSTSQGYPHAMSPDDAYQQHIIQPPMSHSPEVVSISPPLTRLHVQVTDSPHMPPVSSFSPTTQQTPYSRMTPPVPLTQVCLGNPSSLTAYQQDNTLEQVLSPYSSSSSSSSPEDPEGAKVDQVCEDLTAPELDVLMQVMERMERVVSMESLGPTSSSTIREVLPIQLLNDLQNKLCSYNDDNQPNTPQEVFGNPGRLLESSLGVSMSMDPGTDMEMEVDSGTDPSA